MSTDKELVHNMDQITWKYVKPLHDFQAVRNFLRQQKCSLPEGLIECLEKNNGGRPSIKLFDTNVSCGYVFKALLSYNEDDLENIYMVYPTMFQSKMIYPIGTDSAGNFICYNLAHGNYILWKHETNKEEAIILSPAP
ncbi:MAG: SMI1/KNR4 family protein [Christensenellaceae bacterium]